MSENKCKKCGKTQQDLIHNKADREEAEGINHSPCHAFEPSGPVAPEPTDWGAVEYRAWKGQIEHVKQVKAEAVAPAGGETAEQIAMKNFPDGVEHHDQMCRSRCEDAIEEAWDLRLQQLGASKYAEMQRLSDGWQKAEQELSALKVERDGLLEELNIVLKWLTESELVAAKAFAKSLRSALAGAPSPQPSSDMRTPLAQAIDELNFVQNVTNCNSGLCQTTRGKAIVKEGYALLRKTRKLPLGNIVRARLAAGAPSVDPWVRLSERNPTHGEWVWVVYHGKVQRMSAYLSNHGDVLSGKGYQMWTWADEDADLCPKDEISHWCPMLGAPSVEGETKAVRDDG